METTITPNQMFEIAQKDLNRLKAKLEIDTMPKSEMNKVLWESNCIFMGGAYDTFKDGYLEEEKKLQQWLDRNRWMRGLKISNCWLGLTRLNNSIKFTVYQSV